MKLADDQVSALLKLAQSQLELNQLRQASKSYQTLLKHLPTHPEALFGLSEIAARQNKPKQQRERLIELVSVHPQHLTGITQLSRLLSPEQALPYLERALEAHSDVPELLLAAAESLVRAKQTERACFYLDQAVAQPERLSGEDWLKLARLQLRCGELASAARGFEQAISLDPALKQDPRWLDLDASWRQLEAQQQDLDLEARARKIQVDFQVD